MSNSKANQQNKTCIYILATLAITLLVTVLRTIALLFFYDKEIGYYFISGSALPIVANVLYAVAVIFFAISAFLLLKPTDEVKAPNQTAKFVAFVPVATLAIYLISCLIKAFNWIKTYTVQTLIDIFMDSNLAGMTVTRLDIIFLGLGIVFSAVSIVFFVLFAIKKNPTKLLANCGVGLIIFIAVMWIDSYLDFYIPMNSPDKLFFHFGCIGAALLIVAELRAIYGISKPKFYYFSLFTAILALASSSIPYTIANFAGIFKKYTVEYENLFFLGLLIYAIVRAITLMIGEKEKSMPGIEVAAEEQTSPSSEEAEPIKEENDNE